VRMRPLGPTFPLGMDAASLAERERAAP
jgi:hypothetical protein